MWEFKINQSLQVTGFSPLRGLGYCQCCREGRGRVTMSGRWITGDEPKKNKVWYSTITSSVPSQPCHFSGDDKYSAWGGRSQGWAFSQEEGASGLNKDIKKVSWTWLLSAREDQNKTWTPSKCVFLVGREGWERKRGARAINAGPFERGN